MSKPPEVLETETDDFLPDFNKKIDSVKNNIAKVRSDNQEVIRLKQELKGVTTTEDDKCKKK